MKRDSHVIEQITDQRNLERAFDTVVRGTQRKNLKEGKWLISHREEFLADLKRRIEDGTLRVSHFRPKVVREGCKERNIQVFPMRERIAVNAVMAPVDKLIRRRFIRTTSASIKGRGMHELKDYIMRDMREDPEGTRYCYKFDIRKYYETVRQEEVVKCIRKTFKDERLVKMLVQFTTLLPTGMSMGLRASQGLCNLLLSVNLDHHLKDERRVKHFYRYCDDGVVLAGSKEELWEIRDLVHRLIEGIGQHVKPNERIFPVTEGIDFLGYVMYPDGRVKLRKRVKQQFARKLTRVKSRTRRQALVGSLYGMGKHGQCLHLMETLMYPAEYGKIKRKTNKQRMKNFADLGITYTPKDGKKRFAGGTVQLRQLVNVRIEVLDFERDVTTKYGPRWLVRFRDTRNGGEFKFFTDCDEMKSNLVTLEDIGEIPFSTVIAAEYFGDNKVKYKFT